MKICPECREEVEDNFDICWNCNYSFPDGMVLDMAGDNEERQFVDNGERSIDCLRCHVKMRYSGEYKFHEGMNSGLFGNFFELFQNREAFHLYVCPQCGKVEFFMPMDKEYFVEPFRTEKR
ncbi:hypothetical protein [Bacteroides sp.]|uniref:hypothetical protein n=1 Tax=Bacteroides sp. TaxID=29523 RepID=UPI00262D4FA2|nr:hypothetical protein [Bacteroides sp.]MDD3036461.1 hypothetical protein [Bacteroides sp.]